MNLIEIEVLGGYTDTVFVNPDFVSSLRYITKGNSVMRPLLDKGYTVIAMNNGDTFSVEKSMEDVLALLKVKS